MDQQTEVPLPVKFERYILDEDRQRKLVEALPKHISPVRMSRLAMMAFNNSTSLQACSPGSIFSSLLVAATVGLEIGVDGQGYLVPYNGTCTFVPGWKGIVDIVGRSGKAVVKTGAVYKGDEFDFELGTSAYLKHKPSPDSKKERELVWAYSIGTITGTTDPVIEVWSRAQLEEHFEANVVEKLRAKHYRWKHPEMYFRKVPLLQVCKYMPKSIELTNALAAAYAAESGDEAKVEQGVVFVERVDQETGEVHQHAGQAASEEVRQPVRKANKPATQAPAREQATDVTPKERTAFAGNTTDSSPPATEGERNWIKRKAGSGLAHLLEDAGVQSIDTLTKAGFAKCKSLLEAVAA